VKVLTGEQCAQYEAEGYLCLPGFLSFEWVQRLGKAMDKFIERSQSLNVSSASILVEPGHTPENPRLRRIPQTGAFDTASAFAHNKADARLENSPRSSTYMPRLTTPIGGT